MTEKNIVLRVKLRYAEGPVFVVPLKLHDEITVSIFLQTRIRL